MLHGTLLRRYKRFLADVELEDGRKLTVHCPNSGSMKSCCEPGRPVVLSDSNNPKRKLRYTWELIQIGRTWVGVHSAKSNHFMARFIAAGVIPELAGYDELRREVIYGEGGRSRVDLALQSQGRPRCVIEIKHSTMRVGRFAAFPDAVTARGRKHLEDLQWAVKQGDRAVMLFVVGRDDCEEFRPADEIDPAYGEALRNAIDVGVEVLAYRLKFRIDSVELLDRLPLCITGTKPQTGQ